VTLYGPRSEHVHPTLFQVSNLDFHVNSIRFYEVVIGEAGGAGAVVAVEVVVVVVVLLLMMMTMMVALVVAVVKVVVMVMAGGCGVGRVLSCVHKRAHTKM
jgi:hypothetical protein